MTTAEGTVNRLRRSATGGRLAQNLLQEKGLDGQRAVEIRSVVGKKNAISRIAFSSESEAWIAFRSFDSAKSARTVPAAASAGSVAPMTSRNAGTAFSRCSTSGIATPEVMNFTSEP